MAGEVQPPLPSRGMLWGCGLIGTACCSQYYAPDSITINGQACSVQLNIPLSNLLPNMTTAGSSQDFGATVEQATVRAPCQHRPSHTRCHLPPVLMHLPALPRLLAIAVKRK